MMVLTPPQWHERAACRDVDNPDVFFPEAGQSSGPAKSLCAGCPVRAVCLEWSIENHRQAEFGIWGGMTEKERRAERKRRRGAA